MMAGVEKRPIMKPEPISTIISNEKKRLKVFRMSRLEHLYDKCGKDVYETYYGTDKESDDLYTVHRRRPHMFLSPVGVKAINDEFEKRAVEFGVARYEKNNNIDTYDIVRVGDDLRKELGI